MENSFKVMNSSLLVTFLKNIGKIPAVNSFVIMHVKPDKIEFIARDSTNSIVIYLNLDKIHFLNMNVNDEIMFEITALDFHKILKRVKPNDATWIFTILNDVIEMKTRDDKNRTRKFKSRIKILDHANKIDNENAIQSYLTILNDIDENACYKINISNDDLYNYVKDQQILDNEFKMHVIEDPGCMLKFFCYNDICDVEIEVYEDIMIEAFENRQINSLETSKFDSIFMLQLLVLLKTLSSQLDMYLTESYPLLLKIDGIDVIGLIAPLIDQDQDTYDENDNE